LLGPTPLVDSEAIKEDGRTPPKSQGKSSIACKVGINKRGETRLLVWGRDIPRIAKQTGDPVSKVGKAGLKETEKKLKREKQLGGKGELSNRGIEYSIGHSSSGV